MCLPVCPFSKKRMMKPYLAWHLLDALKIKAQKDIITIKQDFANTLISSHIVIKDIHTTVQRGTILDGIVFDCLINFVILWTKHECLSLKFIKINPYNYHNHSIIICV